MNSQWWNAQYFGVPRTREIYERAIADLPDEPAKSMCLAFAEAERRLGEVDRARAVLGHGAQLADPRRDPTYWQKWLEFEVAHGNEETFREMLRVKRSVQAAFSNVNYMAAEMLAGTDEKILSDAEAVKREAEHGGPYGK